MSSYSLFRAEVERGHDQRIKLFFPLAGQTDPVVPEGENQGLSLGSLCESLRLTNSYLRGT